MNQYMALLRMCLLHVHVYMTVCLDSRDPCVCVGLYVQFYRVFFKNVASLIHIQTPVPMKLVHTIRRRGIYQLRGVVRSPSKGIAELHLLLF